MIPQLAPGAERDRSSVGVGVGVGVALVTASKISTRPIHKRCLAGRAATRGGSDMNGRVILRLPGSRRSGSAARNSRQSKAIAPAICGVAMGGASANL